MSVESLKKRLERIEARVPKPRDPRDRTVADILRPRVKRLLEGLEEPPVPTDPEERERLVWRLTREVGRLRDLAASCWPTTSAGWGARDLFEDLAEDQERYLARLYDHAGE